MCRRGCNAYHAGMKRFLPLVGLVLILAVTLASGVHRQVNWANLAAHQEALHAWVAQNSVLAPLICALVYAAAVAVSFPGAVLLTLTCGLLFGPWLGTAVTVLGAGSGAVIVFLAARHALAAVLARKFGTLAARLRPGLERDGFSYLLAIRLIPVFPFAVVNLAAAIVGMRLGPYALATYIGIIPGTLVFASIGAGLGAVLGAGKEPDLSIILRPAVVLPFLGLAVLALLPVAWRRWKGGHG